MKRPITVTVSMLAGLLAIALFSIFARNIIHETVQTRLPTQPYIVSLGDSVAAGAGLSGGNDRNTRGCDVAATAFPFVLGRAVNEPVEQFACSGATVADSANSLLSTQYPAARSFLTGSDVIVTAGANDVGWLQIVTTCAQSDCSNTKAEATALMGKLHTLQQNLTTLLTQIQQQHPRHVIVNTYYDLLASGDTCAERFGITPQKITAIQLEEDALSMTISAAAATTKSTVVPIDFSGHTLCSSDSWIQGVTARTPLHPTAAGQQQIARQDAASLMAMKGQ